LIGVWPHANDQGAWELGFQAQVMRETTKEKSKGTKENTKDMKEGYEALYVVAADPFGDEPEDDHPLAAGNPFVVVQELFLTATALRADVVLPAQAFTEREGSFTSGLRRVQRFYPVVPVHPGSHPDFAITAEIGKRMGLVLEGGSPAAVFDQICAEIPTFKDLSYAKLAETTPQWPALGIGLERKGMYFSGTGYENKQGLGVQLPLSLSLVKTGNLGDLVGDADQITQISGIYPFPLQREGAGDRGTKFLAVPITCLYDHGQTLWPSELLRGRGGNRIGQPWVALNPADAARLGIQQGQSIELEFASQVIAVTCKKTAVVNLDENVPA
jgi:NADH-quinone oxidoreductase subunit G